MDSPIEELYPQYFSSLLQGERFRCRQIVADIHELNRWHVGKGNEAMAEDNKRKE